jgi:hypothetical protein
MAHSGPAAEQGRVEVTCTGRGRHDRVQIRYFPGDRAGDAGAPDLAALLRWLHEGPQVPRGKRKITPSEPWRFSCPQCGRDTQLTQAKFVAAITGLAGTMPVSDTPLELDISSLPF